METVTGGRVIRVVLTGSESTGKSVLAEQLADYYDAELVPEFVRQFAVEKGVGVPITSDDTEAVARGQIALEDQHAARARDIVVMDTDLLSTAVYCVHYFGSCPEWIQHAARERRPDLYLLLDIDVPWVPDGVRDREMARGELQQLFRHAVAASGSPYVTISGQWDERFRRAVNAIDELLV